MEVHDEREDSVAPRSESIERMLMHVALAQSLGASESEFRNTHITISELDPKTGLAVEHLELNFEPTWLTDGYKAYWTRRYGVTLRSELLENTEWKRYAWGIWDEAAQPATEG